MIKGKRKVFLLQDFIINYRVPVYRRLARLPSIDFTFFYSDLSFFHKSCGFRHWEDAQGFPKIKMPYQVLWGTFYQFSFLRHLISGRPDTVICGRPGMIDTLLFLLACKALGIKLLWWAGGVPYIDEERIREWMNLGRMARWFGRLNPRLFLFKQADGMVVYSGHAKSYFRAMGFRKPIFVAPNSVDTDALSGFKKQIEQDPGILKRLRNQYAPNGEKIILTIGRLHREKKINILLDAFEIIQRSCPDTSLIIIGEGSERPHLEKTVTELWVRNVHFTGEIYDDECLSQFLMLCDVYVTPGGASLTVKMAMTLGKPVVTVAYGLEVHEINDGFNGFITGIDDAVGIADKVLPLLKDEQLKNDIGRNAEMTIKERVNINEMIRGFEEAITNLG